MNVILSIRPKYAELILSGTKRYEFRKSIFNSKYVDEAYVYATSPIKRIVGVFKIGDITKDSPKGLWDQFGHLSGMDEAEFFEYFEDIRIGFAIEIKHVEIFDSPCDPKELIPGFSPPQSFCYLKYSLVPECVSTKGYVESRISLSGLTSHDSHPMERSLPANRPASR
jgi:type I restriction enzyme S subunit